MNKYKYDEHGRLIIDNDMANRFADSKIDSDSTDDIISRVRSMKEDQETIRQRVLNARNKDANLAARLFQKQEDLDVAIARAVRDLSQSGNSDDMFRFITYLTPSEALKRVLGDNVRNPDGQWKGNHLYNKYFNIGVDKAQLGKVVLENMEVTTDRILSQKLYTTGAMDILTDLYKKKTPLYKMNLEDYKTNALYEAATKYSGTDAQKFISALEDIGGVNFKDHNYSKVEQSTLFNYASGKGNFDSNLEFNLSNTIRQFKNRLDLEQAEIYKIKDVFSSLKGTLLTTVETTEDLLSAAVDRGTAHIEKADPRNVREINEIRDLLKKPGMGKQEKDSLLKKIRQLQDGVWTDPFDTHMKQIQSAIDDLLKVQKKLGPKYENSEGVIIQKLNEALYSTVQLNDIVQEVKDIDEQLKRTNLSVAEREELIARRLELRKYIELPTDRISRNPKPLDKKYKMENGITRYTILSPNDELDRKGSQIVRKRFGKNGIEESVFTNYKSEFAKGLKSNQSLITLDLGQVNVERLGEDFAVVKRNAIKPSQVSIPLKEAFKGLFEQTEKPLRGYHDHDLQVAEKEVIRNLKRNNVVLYSEAIDDVNEQVKHILDSDLLEETLGRWKKSKSLLDDTGFFSKAYVREDVLGVMFKRAGWSLFADRDYAISTANLAYMEAMKDLDKVTLPSGGEQTAYDSFLKSFTAKFNSHFHPEYFSEGTKGSKGGNHILDKLIQHYQTIGFSNERIEAELVRATRGISKYVKDIYKYDINSMNVKDIRKYMDDRYAMVVGSGKPARDFGEVDPETGNKTWTPTEAVDFEGSREANTKIYGERAFNQERNKIARTKALEAIRGNLTDTEFEKLSKLANESSNMQMLSSSIRTQLMIANDVVDGNKVQKYNKGNIRDIMNTFHNEYHVQKMPFVDIDTIMSQEKAEAAGLTRVREGIINRVNPDLDFAKAITEARSEALDNKITAVKQAAKRVIDESLEGNVAKLAHMEQDLVGMMNLSGQGIFNRSEAREIINDAKRYLGYDSMTFSNDQDLRSFVKTQGRVSSILNDGREAILQIDPKTNEVTYQYKNRMGMVGGVVSNKPREHIMPFEDDRFNYAITSTRETMTPQTKFEIYDELAVEKAQRGARHGYLSHNPVASVQSLRDVLLNGKEVVGIDYETTGLEGGIADKHIIPTEIYAERNKLIEDNFTVTRQKIDDLHVFVKPTDEVTTELRRIASQYSNVEDTKVISSMLKNQDEAWFLRNLAKYSPGLPELDDALYNMYVDKTKRIRPEHIKKLLEHAEAGMKHLSSTGFNLEDAMLKVAEYTKGKTLVGLNVADADEASFKMRGIDNAIAQLEKSGTPEALEKIEKLKEFSKSKNQLIDLMNLHPLVNPDAIGRSGEAQAKYWGIEIKSGHLASVDVANELDIFVKDVNKMLSTDKLSSVLLDEDKYTIKTGDYIAKVSGPVEGTTESITQGVYKWQGVEHTDNGVIAKLNRFGSDEVIEFAAANSNDLQTRLGGDFIKVDATEAAARTDHYIWDRVNRNIKKGLEGYDSFMKHKENAFYAAGGEYRASVLESLNKAKTEFTDLYKKEQDLLKANGNKINWQQLNDTLSTREKILLQSAQKMGGTGNAPSFMQNKIDRLEQSYSSLPADKKSIYTKTAEWYNSREGQILEDALYRTKLLENTKVLGLNKNEGANLIRSINDSVKNATGGAVRETNWVKNIGSIPVKDWKTGLTEMKPLELDVSSVNNAEQGVKNLMRRYKISAKELRDVVSNQIQTPLNSASEATLAQGIYDNKARFQNYQLQDITSEVKGDSLKQLDQDLDKLTRESITKKYQGVTGAESIPTKIIRNTGDIMTELEGLPAHYLDLEVANKDIMGGNYHISKETGSIATIDELVAVAKGYKAQDYDNSKKAAWGLFDKWVEEKNLSSKPEMLAEFKSQFSEGYRQNIRPKLNAAQEAYGAITRQQSREAWRSIVDMATYQSGYGSTSNPMTNPDFNWRTGYKPAQLDALNHLNWTPLEYMDKMSLDDMRKQVLTEGAYAGYQFKDVPQNVLEEYKIKRAPDGVIETSSPQSQQLRERVERYFNKLNDPANPSLHETAEHRLINAAGEPELHYKKPFAEVSDWVMDDANKILDDIKTQYALRVGADNTYIPPQAGMSSTVDATQVLSRDIAEAGGRAIGGMDEAVRSTRMFGGRALAGVGLALGFAGFLAGGTRFSSPSENAANRETNKEQQEIIHGPGNADFNGGQAVQKVYGTDGADIKVSAKSSRGTVKEDIAGMVSKAINGVVDTNINVTTRDDTSKVTRSWMEDRFLELLK